jgi:hypothetical protein
LIVFYCVNTLWIYYGGAQKKRYLSWIIGFTFFPVLEALKSGQANPLLLLGVTGFLLSVHKKKYFLAGIFISFLVLKPHLLYLFGLAVLFWSIYERRWRVIFGAIGSFLFGTIIAWIVNPMVIDQYIHAIQNYPPTDWATPTIGGVLRYIFAPDLIYLQFLAPALGFLWFIYYWFRHKKSWDWIEQAPLLILVSVFSAAYGWSSDQIVSVIAIIQIGVLISLVGLNRYSAVVIIGYVVIDVLAFILQGNAIMIFWLAPALLLWYLVSKRLLATPSNLEQSQVSI